MLIIAWGLALLAVVLVSTAMLGFGCFLATFVSSLSVALVLGVGLFAELSLLSGMISYSVVVQSLLVALGLFLFLRHFAALKTIGSHLPRSKNWLWLIFPFAYFLARFFADGVPQQHSDPIYYHLSAPKFWTELGRIALTESHPSYAQSTLWETVYGIPMLWFGTSKVMSLVTSQLYGQWMHALWGQLGSVVLGAVVLGQLLDSASELDKSILPKVDVGLCLFVSWLCTSLPSYEWLGSLAKNDYILMLFILAATSTALRGWFFATGLLIGMAYSTKVFAAWTGLAVLILIPWRQWPTYALGALLTMLPVLTRNLIYTGNPLFPSFDDKLGVHWISSWWNNHNQSFGGAPRLDSEMLKWLWEKLLAKPLPKLLLALGLVAIAFRSIRLRRVHLRWGAFLSIQLLLCLTMLRWSADGRYGNFIATLWLLTGMAAFLSEINAHRPTQKFGALVLLPLALLINIPLDVLIKIPRDYLFTNVEHYLEQFHVVYDMQTWVRKNIPLQDKILFTAEKQQYYLDRPFETVVEMKKWEEILTPIHTAPELFTTLRAQGFRYVHFSPQAGGYPIVLRPYWPQILEMQNQAVFRSANSLVFDLRRGDDALL